MDLRIQRNASISSHCGSNKSDPSIKTIGTASGYDYLYLCTAKCSAHTLHTRVFLKCTEIDVYIYVKYIYIRVHHLRHQRALPRQVRRIKHLETSNYQIDQNSES